MFEFTEEYESLLRTVRDVAEEFIKPRARETEDSDEFPLDMAKHFFKEGYLQVFIPEQLGGMGSGEMGLIFHEANCSSNPLLEDS